jgi:GT2 family glycosyltransferase
MGPRASIVTRTHQRLVLLRRAVEALVKQTSGPYEWVLVQEGGLAQDVSEIIAIAEGAGWQVQHIYNALPVGRAKAANMGVEAAKADFAIIHDDDDYLLPGALDRLIAALDANTDWVAVCCQHMIAKETVSGTQIIPLAALERAPHEPLDLLSLAERNRYPPITQLFLKEAFLKAGGFDTARTVLEDWLLNLRLATMGTIGQIDDALAVYSLRPQAKADEANSVIAEALEHEHAEIQIRRDVLAHGIANGTTDLGTLLALGHVSRMISRQESRFLKLRQIADRFPWLERAIRSMLK